MLTGHGLGDAESKARVIGRKAKAAMSRSGLGQTEPSAGESARSRGRSPGRQGTEAIRIKTRQKELSMSKDMRGNGLGTSFCCILPEVELASSAQHLRLGGRKRKRPRDAEVKCFKYGQCEQPRLRQLCYYNRRARTGGTYSA